MTERRSPWIDHKRAGRCPVCAFIIERDHERALAEDKERSKR